MPAPRYRSRTFRRVYIKTPSGVTKIHYRARKPSKAVCSNCKKPLMGVPRERPYVMRKTSKTKKRPERPFGGVLCSKCARALHMRNAHKLAAEGEQK